MDKDIPSFPCGIKNEALRSDKRHTNHILQQSRRTNNVLEKAKDGDEISDLERFIDKMSVQDEANAIRLYGRMALELKAEVSFLRKLNQATLFQDVSMNQVSNSTLREEIMNLRRELQTKNNFIKLLVASGNKTTVNEPKIYAGKNDSNNLHLASRDGHDYETLRAEYRNDDGHRNHHFDEKYHNKGKGITYDKLNVKKVEIIGDFMLNNIQVRELSKLNDVRISYFSGCKTPDLLNHIKPSLPRKPDKIIIHVGTNDLMSEDYMLFTVEKIIQLVKKGSPGTQLAFSSIIVRKDRADLSERIKRINSQLLNYCQQHNISFIDNSNITESCLDVSNVHLNRKGNSLLAQNFLDHITDE